jgi:nucleotide-binding universal stress UspA family protein
MNAVSPVDGESAADATRSAERKLAHARSALAEKDVRAEFVPVVGPPARAIVRLAEERKAGLIVVGTRKKRLLERLVEGSVFREVLERATCDVFVVY